MTDETLPPPELGTTRIFFACAGPLSVEAGQRLAGQIIGGLPVAPGEVEIDPAGGGHVLYREEDGATPEELAGAVEWLRRHPSISDVRREPVGDP